MCIALRSALVFSSSVCLPVALTLPAFGCSVQTTGTEKNSANLNAGDAEASVADTGSSDGRFAGGDSGAGVNDGANDGAPDGWAALGSCRGTSSPLLISGQMPYVNVPVGSESGAFVIDFGSTFSSIDLTAFASPGPSTSGCDANELGVTCTVADFAFFASPSSVQLVTEDFSGVGGSVRQAGIVGTDFLSEKVITLDYGAAVAYAAPSSSACSANALVAAGFAAIRATGFYENDTSQLEPFSDVDTNAAAGDPVPNVPTVPVGIAGAMAVAQLDTGFDDDVTPFSVNINEAFYSAIVTASSGALVRDSSLDESLSTCVSGVSESVLGYRLASGQSFAFVATDGSSARSYAHAVIYVKDTPSSASSCGGIGTWTAPAAQVGASFYNDMKTVVFDPFGGQVWIPTK